MTAEIRFESIKVYAGRRVDIECTVVGPDKLEETFDLWFEFSQHTLISNDSIGIALSTLCGRAYTHIHYGIPLSPTTVRDIRAFTLATITAPQGVEPHLDPMEGITLSFSGGFDSLAARALMPADTKLVSMDFGGRFSRERDFFERFDTTIVSTNLLSTTLSRNSWSFMGSGAILTQGDRPNRYHTFGSILEAGPDNLRETPVAAANISFPPFKAAGFANAPYVAGLTEVGTLLVLSHHTPDLIAPSLHSLANPGEEKLYRKKVLAEIVSERAGRDVSIPEVVKPPRPHFTFGQNFALDFLSLYVSKFAGRSVVDDMVADFPQEAEALAKRLDLTLFERANSTLYSNFPPELFSGLTIGLAEAGVCFYTEHDWREYQAVRELLAPYHPIVAKR